MGATHSSQRHICCRQPKDVVDIDDSEADPPMLCFKQFDDCAPAASFGTTTQTDGRSMAGYSSIKQDLEAGTTVAKNQQTPQDESGGCYTQQPSGMLKPNTSPVVSKLSVPSSAEGTESVWPEKQDPGTSSGKEKKHTSAGQASRQRLSQSSAQGEKKKTKAGRKPQNAEAGRPAASSEPECPGMKMANRLTPLQRVEQRRREEDARAKEMGQLVDDILAGKFKKEGNGQPKGDMRIIMPTPYERENTRKLILGGFRAEYKKIGRTPDTSSKTEQYSTQEVEGLQIKGGHRSMPRPAKVALPPDFKKAVGVIPLKKLQSYGCNNARMLLSVYGDIFDVSDRPDKYGSDGPYSWMTGNDISWGFVSGKDTPEQVNKFYDLWKIAPRDFRDKKIQALLAWVAFYEFEYGNPVGRLQEYEKEAGLKGPPMEEAEECTIM